MDLDETKIILVRSSGIQLLMSQPMTLTFRLFQHGTIESVLQRGEKLDDLVAKSEDLGLQSKTFYKTAKKTNACCTYMWPWPRAQARQIRTTQIYPTPLLLSYLLRFLKIRSTNNKASQTLWQIALTSCRISSEKSISGGSTRNHKVISTLSQFWFKSCCFTFISIFYTRWPQDLFWLKNWSISTFYVLNDELAQMFVRLHFYPWFQ